MATSKHHPLSGNPVFLALTAHKAASPGLALGREIAELDALSELEGGTGTHHHVLTVETALLTGLELCRMGIGPEAAQAHQNARRLTEYLGRNGRFVRFHHPGAKPAVLEAFAWLRAQREAATAQQNARALTQAQDTVRRLILA